MVAQLQIDCRVEKSILKIEIIDTGTGLDKDAGKAGIGINNVSLRLDNIYDGKAGLELTQNYPTGIKAMIKVPL